MGKEKDVMRIEVLKGEATSDSGKRKVGFCFKKILRQSEKICQSSISRLVTLSSRRQLGLASRKYGSFLSVQDSRAQVL